MAVDTKPQIDFKKLTSDQHYQLEQYRHTQDQLQVLQDIAMMNQELINVLDDQKKEESEQNTNMGALLMDMRDSLTALREKDAPESPDYAKPVVEAVGKLQKALDASIKSIDVKPVIDAPQVNVSPPSVDLRGVEKAVSNLSKSFQDAVKLIPKVEIPETDNSELLKAWGKISKQLESIDTATRMKPQAPNTIKVTNTDGTSIYNGIANPTDYATRVDEVSATLSYIGKAPVGSATSSAVWQIAKLDTTSGMIKTWADGDALFNNVFNDRATLTYS